MGRDYRGGPPPRNLTIPIDLPTVRERGTRLRRVVLVVHVNPEHGGFSVGAALRGRPGWEGSFWLGTSPSQGGHIGPPLQSASYKHHVSVRSPSPGRWEGDGHGEVPGGGSGLRHRMLRRPHLRLLMVLQKPLVG